MTYGEYDRESPPLRHNSFSALPQAGRPACPRYIRLGACFPFQNFLKGHSATGKPRLVTRRGSEVAVTRSTRNRVIG